MMRIALWSVRLLSHREKATVCVVGAVVGAVATLLAQAVAAMQ